MPANRFVYLTEAVEEAREAYAWYAERDPEVAERFLVELQRARESVTARPRGWTPYYHGTRCFQFRKFPYALVYVEQGDQLVGLAVCHLHRRPGYWKDRHD